MKTSRKLATLVLTAGLATAAMQGTAQAHDGRGSPGSQKSHLTERQERRVRKATEKFRNVKVALAAGYVRVSECTELPGVGGMGFHYLNPKLAGDTVVDPAKPELLVYQQDARGRLHLGAVEYFVADADQNLATDGDRPSAFGTYPFDGPMLGHSPDMPIHYDLHVWLYKHNPAGQLQAWNPKVKC